ncbi:MAG TPA: hypothetical protein VFG27_10575 [Pseudomonadales bacterium]|nr:hypothetical protein [Pseudomonadales bacterium]
MTQAKRQTLVAARLVAAVELERKSGTHVFTGFLTDGLALKAIAIVHAPKALPAVDRAFKRAREG